MSLAFIYFALAGEDRILGGVLDAETGSIEIKNSYEVPWGPEAMATDPQKQFLFVGCHPRGHTDGTPTRANMVYSFQIDKKSGELHPINSSTLDFAPTYLSVDRSGRFLLAAYYRAGKASIQRIGESGAIGEMTQWFDSGGGAHCIQVDPSNRFVFLPHVSTSKVNINTWSPLMSDNHILPSASNTILQFKFDSKNGKLLPNIPFKVPGERGGGPRHYCFHPTLNVVYFSNEQGCAVTVYRLNPSEGTLSPLQFISTLPQEGYDGYASCSSLKLANSGRFLYVLNRGYDSVACFTVDPVTGKLRRHQIMPTEPQAHTLEISLNDKFLFTAGHRSGRLMTYRVHEDGVLEGIAEMSLGKNPKWILTVGQEL